MSDYIERKSIRNLYSYLNPEDKVRVAQVLIDIDAIPSDDAVEVVRCKDCKYCHYEQEDDIFYCDVTSHRFYFDNHYCSYGERKESE